MGVTAKLGLYALGLVVVFVAMFGVGSVVGPVLPEEGAPDRVEETTGEEQHRGEGHGAP
ncbi:hypothetical protein [Nocardiopsis algeriensis]|uniref:Uncharacterized protein n=1 Tax=Nocardiopsis algeriensis TaxID=1478215 RepID=A0A841IRN8_9ACTN|nr:hypothetical protein [Nocardiopsis algeriensis]MBB6120792.1 hypothetical protein [Nocardiopsis algeriensis]